MTAPFRERRLSSAEVRKILRRALDLAERDAETEALASSMTEDELARHAAELGIPGTAIRGAVNERAPLEEKTEASNELLGAPLRTLLEEEIDGEIGADSHEDLVEAIQTVMGEAGQVQIVGKTVTWTPTVLPQAQPRQLSVTVRSRNGKTLVRVDERHSNLAAGLYFGIGFGFGLGGGVPVAMSIALATKSGLPATLAGLACLVIGFLIPRLIFPYVVRRRTRKHRDLRDRLARVVRAAARAGAPRKRKRQRIAAAAAEAEAEAESEAEAEAEAEVVGGRARR
ncbi:hypothetical protein [Polyangium spumosum]|uniref:Uncharacterized protein n=1 Tax=Polyangium spumosum TaxID=889282 RepID=A0A6N7PGP8_9BACT|nr:hypothetical protein [Polyangium spumosum]MRG91179.1 hypothetical protein [Polyangium spumosum]